MCEESAEVGPPFRTPRMTVARLCTAAVAGCLVFLVVVWLAFPWVFGDTPFVHTPGIARKLDYAAAVVVAPNGGILFFWPVALALATVLILGFKRRGDRLTAVSWPGSWR